MFETDHFTQIWDYVCIIFQCKLYAKYVFINSVLASLSRSIVIPVRLILPENIDICILIYWLVNHQQYVSWCLIEPNKAAQDSKYGKVYNNFWLHHSPGVGSWTIEKLSSCQYDQKLKSWQQPELASISTGPCSGEVLLYFLSLNRPAIGQTVSRAGQQMVNLKRHKLQDHDMRYSANMGKVCIIIIYN